MRKVPLKSDITSDLFRYASACRNDGAFL